MIQANGRELCFSMVDGDFKKFEGKWSLKTGKRYNSFTWLESKLHKSSRWYFLSLLFLSSNFGLYRCHLFLHYVKLAHVRHTLSLTIVLVAICWTTKHVYFF